MIAARTIALALAALLPAASAQLAEMHVMKPSTTGIPGEELRSMEFDPQGNLWVTTRMPFWGESGIAMLPAAQVPHEPLPGGGFDTGAWRVWSSVQHPIPSPFIGSPVFDDGGVIWFGSGSISPGGGLTRFVPDAATPGEMWFTYDADNSPLVADGIYSLSRAADGTLWMTNGHVNFRPSVFSFQPTTGEWQQFDMGEELPWPANFALVNSVHVGPSGKVYVTHGSLSGFAEYDGKEWTLHAGGAQLDSILEDLAGNVWFTTGGTGLWNWNGTGFQNWPSLGGTATIAGLEMDGNGLVYVSTWYGLTYRMINGTTPQLFVNAAALPYHIEARPNGEVWIGNYGGNGVSGTARHYTAGGQLLERITTWNSGLPDYFVDDIFTDGSGNVWFATGEAGLSRMAGSDGAPDAPTHWRNWGDHNDGSEPYPWAGNEPMSTMLDNGDGTIWMGGNGAGLWHEASGTFLGFWNWQNSALSSDQINDFARDANGDLWAATDGSGVFRYDPATDDWVHHGFSNPYSYSQERILTLATDHDGLLWAGAEYGLHTFDGTTWTALHETGAIPFNAWSVSDIEVAPDGDIWLGTQEGLAHRDGAQWAQYTQANSPLLGVTVRDVTIRDDGLVGVASFQASTFPYVGGVNTFDGTTWQSWTTASSDLTHFQTEAVQFDADGDLWASCMSEGVVEILLGDPWTELGGGVAGVAGVPQLAGTGSLQPGSATTLELSGAAPSAATWLLFGLSPANLPLKGGTLVPQPQFVLVLPTSAAGGLLLPFTWPASAPSGTSLYGQAWVQDAAAVKGFAASNGLLGVTP